MPLFERSRFSREYFFAVTTGICPVTERLSKDSLNYGRSKHDILTLRQQLEMPQSRSRNVQAGLKTQDI